MIRWKSHCINQLMTRGKLCPDRRTSIYFQLAIGYWSVSSQISCCSNLVAPGAISDFSENFLLIQKPYLKL